MTNCIPPEGKRTDWICIGDAWGDRDCRNPGREVTVVEIDESRAHERAIIGRASTGRRVRILARRMTPTSTGYDLITKVCPEHKDSA